MPFLCCYLSVFSAVLETLAWDVVCLRCLYFGIFAQTIIPSIIWSASGQKCNLLHSGLHNLHLFIYLFLEINRGSFITENLMGNNQLEDPSHDDCFLSESMIIPVVKASISYVWFLVCSRYYGKISVTGIGYILFVFMYKI